MRSLPLFLLAMLVLAPPGPAAASPAALQLPTRLQAGERVEVRWSGLPADAHEVELELSLEGGRWVRISPELEAAEGRFLWRVPAIASARARVRLRAGGERFEQVVAMSAETRIDDARTNAMARSSGDDWWRLGERATARGGQLASAAPTLVDGGASNAVASAPEAGPLLSSAPRLSAPHSQPQGPTASPVPPAAPPRDRSHPMRN